jgi:membrane fusion protein (multidrug efflux system)
MRSVWINIVASLLLLLAVGGTLWLIVARRQQIASVPKEAPPERPEIVGLATAEPTEFRSIATAIGTVLAPRSIQLKSELVGTVTKVSFEPGQIVEQDQLLVQFDTSVEEAQLASALAMQQIAESTFKRTQQAASVKAISELELEQAVSMLAQAKAEVARLGAIIRKKTLKAPFRARAGLFDLHAGQYLPEGTAITMLQGIETYAHIDFMMPQQVSDSVKVGDSIQVESEGKELDAIVIAIDSQADRITRNVMARGRIEELPESLQPNDSVKVAIPFGPVVSSVKIPITALRNAPTGPFVYRQVSDDKDPGKYRVRMTKVLPGRSSGDWIAIMQGLQAGDIVVTDGSFKLREGVLVASRNEEPTP